jgi:ABC-type transporter Mla MlaB component
VLTQRRPRTQRHQTEELHTAAIPLGDNSAERAFDARPSADINEVAPNASSTCLIGARCELGITVFAIEGSLNAVTASGAGAKLAAAFGELAVVLDLTGITQIDENGVHMLRNMIDHVNNEGGQVAIARPWRHSQPLIGLIGVAGLVFLAISASSGVEWLSDPRHVRNVQLEMRPDVA